MKKLLYFILGMGTAIPVFGAGLTTTDLSTTIGLTIQQCAPADSGRKTLFIENPVGNSVNLGYCIGNACVPNLSTLVGTSVLAPGNADSWSNDNSPREALNCIAGGAATLVTIRSAK